MLDLIYEQTTNNIQDALAFSAMYHGSYQCTAYAYCPTQPSQRKEETYSGMCLYCKLRLLSTPSRKFSSYH
jgi:hypothetical protein